MKETSDKGKIPNLKVIDQMGKDREGKKREGKKRNGNEKNCQRRDWYQDFLIGRFSLFEKRRPFLLGVYLE